MPHRFLSGCLLMVVSVSMMPHGEAVSAALFISTMVPMAVSTCRMIKQRRFMRISIQVIMLLSMAVSLMCRDRQRTEVHLQAAVPRVTRRMTETTGRMTRRRKRRRKAIKRQRKRRRKQRNIQRQRNRRQLRRRRRNLKQVHLKLLRQKRRLLRPVRRIQKHLRRIRLKQVHRNRNQSRNQSRKPRRKGWWMLSLYPAYNR